MTESRLHSLSVGTLRTDRFTHPVVQLILGLSVRSLVRALPAYAELRLLSVFYIYVPHIEY